MRQQSVADPRWELNGGSFLTSSMVDGSLSILGARRASLLYVILLMFQEGWISVPHVEMSVVKICSHGVS